MMLGIALSLLFRGAAADPLPAQLTPAQMRDDLTYLRDKWSHEERSLNEATRAEFDRQVSEAAERVDKLSVNEFSLEVARLVAIGGNGHSAADVPAMPLLPLRLWWFDDGLFVVSASPQHADLLGARVLRIGSRSVDEAQELVAKLVPGNEGHRKVESPPLLVNPLALKLAKVSSDADSTTLLVVDRTTHKQRRVSLRAEAVERWGYNTWTELVPSDASAPNRWPHVLDAVSSRPEAFKPPVDLSYEWLSTTPRVLYIRSNKVFSDGDTRLDMKLIEMTMKELVAGPSQAAAQAVIVDLRFNMGGSFLNTILFSEALPQLVAPSGKVLVLTGPVTFSAAIVTAAMLKKHGGERVEFVGGGMGDYDRFWAEGANVKLPNSGLSVRYSDGFHDWSRPCPDCFWATRIFGPDRPISLQPDVPVAMMFGDYVRGVDAPLNRAMELAGVAKAPIETKVAAGSN
jgi:hypothetical protein